MRNDARRGRTFFWSDSVLLPGIKRKKKSYSFRCLPPSNLKICFLLTSNRINSILSVVINDYIIARIGHKSWTSFSVWRLMNNGRIEINLGTDKMKIRIRLWHTFQVGKTAIPLDAQHGHHPVVRCESKTDFGSAAHQFGAWKETNKDDCSVSPYSSWFRPDWIGCDYKRHKRRADRVVVVVTHLLVHLRRRRGRWICVTHLNLLHVLESLENFHHRSHPWKEMMGVVVFFFLSYILFTLCHFISVSLVGLEWAKGRWLYSVCLNKTWTCSAFLRRLRRRRRFLVSLAVAVGTTMSLSARGE